MHLGAARLTNKAARCAGISVNTSALTEADSREVLAHYAAQTGLPCVDPMRDGVEPIVTYLLTTD